MKAYKACEKRWKSSMIDDLLLDGALVDVRNLSTEQQKNVCRVGSWKWSQNLEERPVLGFDGFGKSHHGLCVIPSALDEITQLHFAHACLTEFVELPHLTNLHKQNHQFSGIWNQACESYPQNPSEFPLLAKLSWSALGYHYDWTARKYHRDKHSPVPESLQQLGKKCAAACGMKLAPEAIIINFYKTKSAMGGHLDDAEFTMDHPVISLSLGSSCIFLIGGQSKDEPPLQILLRSGDIVVMGGVSRRCYHGVARVFPTRCSLDFYKFDAISRSKAHYDELEYVKRYLNSQRININIRQVYPGEISTSKKDSQTHSPQIAIN